MVSFTYGIGDLHGRLDVLAECLDKIKIHRISQGDLTGENTTIVFLGDYIDRGPKSKQVLDTLRAGPTDDSKWVIIKGNHEEMCGLAHEREDLWLWWIRNGGETTVASFGGRVPDDYLEWLYRLPTRYQDEHRFYVHAGVAPDTLEQAEEVLMWCRYGERVETPFPGGYVVHGHTPFSHGPIVLETRCNLDTKAYRTGYMSVAIFDDSLPGKPIGMLPVRTGYAG